MDIRAAVRALSAHPLPWTVPSTQRPRKDDDVGFNALSPYAKVFDKVYVFSPSVEIDSAWDPVREHAKGLKHSGFFSEWDVAALIRILDEQRIEIKDLKLKKTNKPLPQCLVIIDDWADSPAVMHSASGILTTL